MDVVKAAGDAGLIVLMAGPDVLRIAPSLVISLDEILEGPGAARDARSTRAAAPAQPVPRRCSSSGRSRRTICPRCSRCPSAPAHGLTTLPANRERLASRIDRSLASFAGTRVARRRVLRVRAGRRDAATRVVGISGDRGRGRPERALVQLSRRHAGPRVARARRLYRGADAVPRQRPHRPHRALLAVPRPGVSPWRRTGRCSRRAACSSSPNSRIASRRR